MSVEGVLMSAADWKVLNAPYFPKDSDGRYLAESDPPELPDADINPDEAEPLPPDEPVKTDPIPEETE